MARNASGTYSLPAGNPVVTGTTIEASWANTTLGDIATEITDSLSRSGKGGMLVAFEIADGTEGLPALSFSSDTNTGIWRSTGDTLNISTGGTERVEVDGTSLDSTVPVNIRNSAPHILLEDSDATADDQVWKLSVAAGVLTLESLQDDESTVDSTPLAINHDGTISTLSPITTRGDLITKGASTVDRLAVGTVGQLLRSDGTDVTWADVADATGGWEFVATKTLASDSLVEFFHDGIDNAGADLAADYDYRLIWDNVKPSSSGTTYLMQLYEAGAYRAGATDYYQIADGTLAGTTDTGYGNFYGTFFPEGGQNTDTTYTTLQSGVFGTSIIRNAASTTFSTHLYTTCYTGGTAGILMNHSHGVPANGNLARAATKFKIYTAAGTLNTGKIHYYRSKRT